MLFDQTWSMWKKGFEVWDAATTRYLDAVMRAPAVLVPSGSMVTAMAKAQARRDKLVAGWWSLLGLPTRREQERAMHSLHQLHSRIIDLEEQIDELRHASSRKES